VHNYPNSFLQNAKERELCGLQDGRTVFVELEAVRFMSGLSREFYLQRMAGTLGYEFATVIDASRYKNVFVK
jgi:hypothetical protein